MRAMRDEPMQETLNHVHVIGRLVRDPEVRGKSGGRTVTTLTLVTLHEYMKSGRAVREWQWHRVVLFYDQAEHAGCLHEGAMVEVKGRLHTSKFEDRSGHTRYSTQIMASRFRAVNRENVFSY